MALMNSQSLGRKPRTDQAPERTAPMPDETAAKPEGTAAEAAAAPAAPQPRPDTGAKLPEHAQTPAGPSQGTAADALPTEGQADRAVERATDRAEGGSSE